MDLLNIREFKEGDAERVYEFFQGLSEQSRYFFHPYSFLREEAESFTGDGLKDPDIRRFMAVHSEGGRDVMIGHVFFWDWDRLVPWLGIAVRDGFQGMGLGKKLMDFAVEEAVNQGKGGILLTTMTDNHRAQALYKSVGFETIGQDRRGEHLLILNFADRPKSC